MPSKCTPKESALSASCCNPQATLGQSGRASISTTMFDNCYQGTALSGVMVHPLTIMLSRRAIKRQQPHLNRRLYTTCNHTTFRRTLQARYDLHPRPFTMPRIQTTYFNLSTSTHAHQPSSRHYEVIMRPTIITIQRYPIERDNQNRRMLLLTCTNEVTTQHTIIASRKSIVEANSASGNTRHWKGMERHGTMV